MSNYVSCNFCGQPCGCDGDTNFEGGDMGLVNQTIQGGYYSTPGNGQGAFDDGTKYTFSLCEFCLDWLFQQFAIPPRVTSEGRLRTFVPAAERVARDTWRRRKEEWRVEYELRNALRGFVTEDERVERRRAAAMAKLKDDE